MIIAPEYKGGYWRNSLKHILYLILLNFLFFSQRSLSEEEKSYVNPLINHQQYGPFNNNTGTGNLAQKIIHLTDNATLGAVQSTLSMLHIPYSFIDISVIGDHSGKRKLKFDSYNSPNSEIVQFILKGNPINASAYSLGLGQVTPEGAEHIEDHEAGHSVASATLGPLYLPVVFITYAGHNWHGGFVEDWADMEANPKDYSLTQSVRGGFAKINIDGQDKTVLVLNYALIQTQQQSFAGQYSGLDSLKIYNWLKTDIRLSIGEKDDDCDCEQGIFEHGSISILEKDFELVVSDDLVTEGLWNLLIQTTQDYGRLSYTEGKGVEFIPMRWSGNIGAEYNPVPGLKLQASTGPIIGSLVNKDNFSLMGGFSFKTGIDYKDYIRLQNTTDMEFYSNGNSILRTSTDLTNRFRDPRRDMGVLHSIDFGLTHKYQELELDNGQRVQENYFGFGVGGRF